MTKGDLTVLEIEHEEIERQQHHDSGAGEAGKPAPASHQTACTERRHYRFDMQNLLPPFNHNALSVRCQHMCYNCFAVRNPAAKVGDSPTCNWAIVGLLSLGLTLAYVDGTILSTALASPAFESEFAISDCLRGLWNSAFFWSYALLQVPCGYLAGRYGVRWPYAEGIFGWSFVPGLTCMASSALAPLCPAPFARGWRSHRYPRQHTLDRPSYSRAPSRAGGGSPVCRGQVRPGHGRPPRRHPDGSPRLALDVSDPWRGSAIFVAPWLMLVRDRRAGDGPPGAATRTSAPGHLALASDLRLLLGTVAYNYFNLTWLPAYFVEHSKSSGTYPCWGWALIRPLHSFGMAATAIGSGASAGLLIQRGAPAITARKLFTVGGLEIASLDIFGAITAIRQVAVAAAVVATAGLGLTTANYWALTQTLTHSAAIGRMAGLQKMASNLAEIAAPALTGGLVRSTGDYRAPLWTILAWPLIGLAAYLFLVRAKYVSRNGVIPR